MCAHNARSTGARPIAACRLQNRLSKLELVFSGDKMLSMLLPLQVGAIGMAGSKLHYLTLQRSNERMLGGCRKMMPTQTMQK